ncbi:MAG TPA: serine hydrolase [Bacilli bacterium]|nr:serine hydrolase [Bacilli bacterium]
MKTKQKAASIWETSTPAEQQMEGKQLALFEKELQKEKIISCVILRNDRLVFEYFKNKKAAQKIQKINSVTKSVVSALIGIAIDQGRIPDVHVPLHTYFPKLANDPDPRKREWTLFHLLTMTTGHDWPEWTTWNGFSHMFYSDHWVNYVLERKVIDEPGTKMTYNTGASHLLTAVLQQATGMTALAFAEKHLFRPLGITDAFFYDDRQGINRGGDGLRLTTMDMAKFGMLYLREGMWGKKRLISQDWVRESLKPRFTTYPHIGDYGYQWWSTLLDRDLGEEPDNRYYFALGHGGQYIILLPQYNAVACIASEMYDASLVPMKMFREHVLPAFHE